MFIGALDEVAEDDGENYEDQPREPKFDAQIPVCRNGLVAARGSKNRVRAAPTWCQSWRQGSRCEDGCHDGCPDRDKIADQGRKTEYHDLAKSDDPEEQSGMFTEDPEEIYTLDWNQDALKLVFGVDSGAAVTILKTDECSSYPLDTSVKREFKAANKTMLKTEGRRNIDLVSGGLIRAEVGNVSKNLMSVADLEDAGFHVQFSGEGQRYAIHRETGQKFSFVRRGRVYDLEVAVQPGPRRLGDRL